METPRYLRPTVAASLHQYTNKDQDAIRHSFNPSNFTYLSKLPHKIKPNSICKSIRRISRNTVNQTVNVAKHSPKAHHFNSNSASFEWMPDAFNSFQEQLRKERKLNEKLMRKISPVSFRSPGVVKRTKYQEGFSDQLSPYITINAPFEAIERQMNRLKWVNACHILHTHKKTAKIKELVSVLKETIGNEWENASFEVGLNEKDFIELRFSTNSIDNPAGLMAYMNVFVKTDAVKHGLSKEANTWGSEVQGKLVFQLRPAWLKQRRSMAFNTVLSKRNSHSPSFFEKPSVKLSPLGWRFSSVGRGH